MTVNEYSILHKYICGKFGACAICPINDWVPCNVDTPEKELVKYALAAYRKSALRVLPSREEAETWMELNDAKGCYIEERKGESRKCMNYCKAAPFCHYYLTNCV